MISSFANKYDVITTPLMLGKDTLSVKDVTALLTDYDRMKQAEHNDRDRDSALMVDEGETM